MKNNNIWEYIKPIFDKYKYPIIALALGVFMILIPTGKPVAKEPAVSTKDEEVLQALASLLSQIEGVGRVKVSLTQAGSGRTVYATDSRYGGESQEIVVVSESGSQKPLVERTTAPNYRGAVVVCDGGDDSKVKLEVTNAVKALTGVSSDNIIILKMKQ